MTAPSAGTPRRAAALALAAVAVVLALAGSAAAAPALAPLASPTYPPLTGSLSGPTTVGTQMSANYTVNASGGPAEAANGTVLGAYTYHAYFTAVNRTGIVFGPASQGVLVNQTITLSFTAPNVTESVELAVLVNSTYNGVNASHNLTVTVQIVQPFVLAATLVVGSAAGVSAFPLAVELDGRPVGAVAVPTLTAGATYGINFRYVDTGLAPGWHAFSVSVAPEHGLVTFAGGAQNLTWSFYVAGPAPDYTVWYVAGTVAFVGAIFIYSMRVGARRRGRSKK